MKRQHRKRPPVVVITGASAGVGRATVREFAKHGARIGLIARSRDGLEGARREVIEAGGRALAIPADVAFPDQVESAADAVERMLGPIDVWVNNAMVSVLSPAIEVTPEEFKRVTDVTYLGYVYDTLAALKWMKPRDRQVPCAKIHHVPKSLCALSILLRQYQDQHPQAVSSCVR